MAVGFDKGREAPFADSLVRQHSREDCDFEGFDLCVLLLWRRALRT
jgi:hypothetical protein